MDEPALYLERGDLVVEGDRRACLISRPSGTEDVRLDAEELRWLHNAALPAILTAKVDNGSD